MKSICKSQEYSTVTVDVTNVYPRVSQKGL